MASLFGSLVLDLLQLLEHVAVEFLLELAEARNRRFSGGRECQTAMLPAERAQFGHSQSRQRHEMIQSILRTLTWQAPQPFIVAQFLPPEPGHLVTTLERDQEQADELAERLVQAIRCPPEREQLVFGENALPSRGA